MINKFGTARWNGGLRDGEGQLSTQSGSLKDQPYSFAKRFEGQAGTNPEELIGASHAACYAMALSLGLEGEGLTPDTIDAKSQVSLEEVDGGFAITRIHLTVEAKVPGATDEQFQKAAQATKEGCPVSKVLKGAEITLEAKLV